MVNTGGKFKDLKLSSVMVSSMVTTQKTSRSWCRHNMLH